MMAIMRKLINNNVYKIVLWIFLFMMAVGSGVLVHMGTEKHWVVKVYDQLLPSSRLEMLLKVARHQQEEFRRKGIIIAGKNAEKEAIIKAKSNAPAKSTFSCLLNSQLAKSTFDDYNT